MPGRYSGQAASIPRLPPDLLSQVSSVRWPSFVAGKTGKSIYFGKEETVVGCIGRDETVAEVDASLLC